MKTKAKITFLIVTVIFFAHSKLMAQCTPATTLPGYGIFPDSMAIATVNVPYQQVLQFEAPVDTMIAVPVLGKVPAKIDSIRITGVIGLPAGFTYQCNKPTCMVIGGEIGCAMFSGTPTQVGNYPLQVLVHTSGRANILGSWVAQAQSDTNLHYSILVKSATGIFEIIDHSQPVKVYPNPAQNKLFIDARALTNSTAIVKLYDLNGRLIRSENISVHNTPSIDISALKPGIYFAEINDITKDYRVKFIVQ